ncbi:MAG TPA: hypothetical protein VGL11_25205 [Candidatus Binatia bacterium]|jgi:hypothetical protein
METLRGSRFLIIISLIAFLGIGKPAYSGGGGVPWSCGDYDRLPDQTRVALATGYLEGVQAALDKEMRDMLVPPEDRDHPIWWVLPEGEVSPDNLESALTAFCKYTAGKEKKLADAFSSIAARKDGSPRIGLPLSDGPAETWRTILGRSKLRCANYLSTAEPEQANLIYGYYLGTSAIKAVLKTPPELSLTVWPDADYRAVQSRVREACEKSRYANSTVRDVLWLLTAEMGVEKRIAGAK